jgi:dTDP-4-dehydrorhamnose reductase
MTILLLGSTGYIGSEFLRQIAKRGWHVDVKHYWEAPPIISGYDLCINAAAYVAQPSVSVCDAFKAATFIGNTCLPTRLAQVCEVGNVPLLHLSTACLYDEAKNYEETDRPTRSFDGHCGTYLLSKWLAEMEVTRWEKNLICRIRLPFDQFHNERNYLSKVIRYPQVYDHVNSLSHRADCVKAMLDLVTMRAPFGIYNICNPGQISARQVVAMLGKKGLLKQDPEFVPGPCPGCTLSTEKLLSAGVKIRPLEEAVVEAIENWQT